MFCVLLVVAFGLAVDIVEFIMDRARYFGAGHDVLLIAVSCGLMLKQEPAAQVSP